MKKGGGIDDLREVTSKVTGDLEGDTEQSVKVGVVVLRTSRSELSTMRYLTCHQVTTLSHIHSLLLVLYEYTNRE